MDLILATLAGLALGIILGAWLLARRVSKRTGVPTMQVLRGGGNAEE